MKILHPLSVAVLLTAALPAQQNDFAGINVSADGITPPPNHARSICGDTFSCTPLTLAALRGDTVQYFVMGTFNDPFILIGTLNTQFIGCAPLNIPGLVNNLVVFPSPATFTLAVGATNVSDNGRCNGGSTPLTTLFTIPMNIPPGSFALQAAAGSPLSSGGNGFAMTRAVVVNYQ